MLHLFTTTTCALWNYQPTTLKPSVLQRTKIRSLRCEYKWHADAFCISCIYNSRTLERQAIQLIRTQNSLLAISRVPPFILGHIFCLTVERGGDFEGLRRGSYNFLLVCYHWFEVASGTPELWSFWGNRLCEWSRRYKRSNVHTPLDLVLEQSYIYADPVSLDGPLRAALKHRVVLNSLRSVHLRGSDAALLHSIISSLIPEGEGVRSSSIESMIIGCLTTLDLSGLFVIYRFSKLRHLSLETPINDTVWNHLGSHTGSLTSLSLLGNPREPAPNTSQSLSVLTSNPQLQRLFLNNFTIPDDGDYGYTPRVPLRHLKNLELRGKLRPVLRLLPLLDHPGAMDSVAIALRHLAGEVISGIPGPYMSDLLRHGHFQPRKRLGVIVHITLSCVSVDVISLDDETSPTISLPEEPQFQLSVTSESTRLYGTPGEIIANLASYFAREYVIFFSGEGILDRIQEVVATMPNIQELHLVGTELSDGFVQPDPYGPLANTKLLPSL